MVLLLLRGLGLAIGRQNKIKSMFELVLLISATVLVVLALITELTSSRTIAKSAARIDVDRCELMLRINDSLVSAGNLFMVPKAMEATGQSTKQLAQQALSSLLSAHEQNPKDPLILAKALIVSEYLANSGEKFLSDLKLVNTNQASELFNTLDLVYSKGILRPQIAYAVAKNLDRLLPSSWYNDQARLALYQKSPDQTAYLKLEEQLSIRNFVLLARMLLIIGLGTLLFIAGLVVLTVQLLANHRPSTTGEELSQIKAPVDYGPLKVYAVFIAWLATQLLIGVAAHPFVKRLSEFQLGATSTAAIMMAVYIISNGPGLIYIYIFALRPKQVKFLDSLKIRFSYGLRGPSKMVLAGVLAWLAAIPLMALAYYISSKFLGSQGSTNPIIAIVTESARRENFSATLIFYITLGVLAPICEETLFRGFLYTYCRRFWGVLPSTFTSAVLFSLAHLDPGGLLPLFCLGCVFAFVLEKTKSVIPAMIAHALWNSCTFTLVIFLFSS